MLRFDHPDFGVAGVGASPPLSDALFPVRRQEGGITTGVAIHNLESSPGLLRCDLMREGVLLDAASIPLEANGQTSWLIDQAFPAADTSDFAGSVVVSMASVKLRNPALASPSCSMIVSTSRRERESRSSFQTTTTSPARS